jgi:hypothetical protein
MLRRSELVDRSLNPTATSASRTNSCRVEIREGASMSAIGLAGEGTSRLPVLAR